MIKTLFAVLCLLAAEPLLAGEVSVGRLKASGEKTAPTQNGVEPKAKPVASPKTNVTSGKATAGSTSVKNKKLRGAMLIRRGR